MKERSQSQALCKLKPTCFKYLNVKKPETLGAILGGYLYNEGVEKVFLSLRQK
jgi:hypothetical protein